MKLLLLHSELGVLRGGGENFSRNLFAAFADRGHSVHAAFVADRRGRYPLPLQPDIHPIPIRGWWSRDLGQATLSSIGRCLPVESRYLAGWDRIQQALSWRTIRWHNQRFRRRVAKLFSEQWARFDAVYVHGDTILASMAAQHRPTVLRLPGPVSADLEPLLRKVHAVCANGDALLQTRAFLGDHATELPVGIDTNLFRPGCRSARAALNWTEQHRVVGYVGRLTHIKGIDLLVSAFRQTLDRNPNIRLLIVGSGEEERNVRSALSKELAGGFVDMEPDVGHETLGEWYRAMDLLVMPSRYENFSNAILEGMACGIPFLAADVGGNNMMAKTGSGWVFESGSASALSASLDKILAGDCGLKSRGRVGLDYVRRQHSWSSTAERLEHIIETRMGVR